VTEFHLSLWHLTDLLGTVSAPEHLREVSVDFAVGSALTLLPGTQEIQVTVIHDDAEAAEDRATLAHSLTLNGIPYAPGSWLRPQFRFGLERRAAILTVWRIGHSLEDSGRNAFFSMKGSLEPQQVCRIAPIL